MFDLPAHRDHWSLDIFQMTSHDRQQRVLQAFARVDMPGVQVLGVVRTDSWFVIIDSVALVDEIRSRRILRSIDPLTTRTHRTASRTRPEPAGAQHTPQRIPRPGEKQAATDMQGH